MLLTLFSNSIIQILIGVLVLIVFFVIYSKPWKHIEISTSKTYYVLLVIVFVGLFFRFQQPLQHYIYFDEDYYLSNAKDITLGDFKATDVILKKTGYELLLAIIFFVFSTHSALFGFGLNIILGLLTIPLVYFITRKLWSEEAGLASAFFVAILPEHIRWSVTTSLEVPATFFILLSILLFLIFTQSKNWLHFTTAIFISLYVSFMRPELVILPGLLLVYLLFNFGLMRLAWEGARNTFLSSIIVLLFAFSSILTLNSTKTWSGLWKSGHNVDAFFSFNYFISNISDILNYNFHIFNFLFFILIIFWIFGVYIITQKKNLKKNTFFILVIGVVLFCYYNSFFSGGYSVSSVVHSRFAVIWLTLFSVVSGIGLVAFLESVSKQNLLKILLIIFIIPTFQIQYNSEAFFPKAGQIWAIKETQAITEFAKINPKCAYLSAHPYPLRFQGFESYYTYDFIAQKNISDLPDTCLIFWEASSCSYENKETCDLLLGDPFWKKLPYDSVNIWQYFSKDSDYIANIPEFEFQESESVFVMLKSIYSK